MSAAHDNVSWLEPREFRKREAAAAGQGLVKIVVFTLLAGGVFTWLAARYELGRDAVTGLLVATGGIIVVSILVFLSTRVMRISVKITDKAIVREYGEDKAVFKFKDISHCEIGARRAGGRQYDVLIVILKRGDHEFLCLDPVVTVDRVQAVLERGGVRVRDACVSPAASVISAPRRVGVMSGASGPGLGNVSPGG